MRLEFRVVSQTMKMTYASVPIHTFASSSTWLGDRVDVVSLLIYRWGFFSTLRPAHFGDEYLKML